MVHSNTFALRSIQIIPYHPVDCFQQLGHFPWAHPNTPALMLKCIHVHICISTSYMYMNAYIRQEWKCPYFVQVNGGSIKGPLQRTAICSVCWASSAIFVHEGKEVFDRVSRSKQEFNSGLNSNPAPAKLSWTPAGTTGTPLQIITTIMQEQGRYMNNGQKMLFWRTQCQGNKSPQLMWICCSNPLVYPLTVNLGLEVPYYDMHNLTTH